MCLETFLPPSPAHVAPLPRLRYVAVRCLFKVSTRHNYLWLYVRFQLHNDSTVSNWMYSFRGRFVFLWGASKIKMRQTETQKMQEGVFFPQKDPGFYWYFLNLAANLCNFKPFEPLTFTNLLAILRQFEAIRLAHVARCPQSTPELRTRNKNPRVSIIQQDAHGASILRSI